MGNEFDDDEDEAPTFEARVEVERAAPLTRVTHRPLHLLMERHVGPGDVTWARYTYVECSCGVKLVVRATSCVEGYEADADEREDAKHHFGRIHRFSDLPWRDDLATEVRFDGRAFVRTPGACRKHAP